MLQAFNISKNYNPHVSKNILDSITLSIPQGQIVGIMGKSGSGKSTLLHILSSLLSPTSGQIIFDDQDISKFTDTRKDEFRSNNIGFIFQTFYALANNTVTQNVILPLNIANNHKAKDIALEYIKLVGLEDKANTLFKDLSGGEKQKVCIARSLVNQPKIIFADEPTGSLDSKSGQEIMDILLKVCKESNTTLVIVTHDEDLVSRCQRAIYLADGKIINDELF